jgi:hypothetical protein
MSPVSGLSSQAGYNGYATTPTPSAPPPSPVAQASPVAAPTSAAPVSTGYGGGSGGYGGGSGGYGGGDSTGVPRPSAAPLPPQGYAPPEVPEGATAPRQRTGNESWQTRADEGWRRASEAAMPSPAGTTRSGLPKRVPQAQLVPGGVAPSSARERNKRTPEEVRGLLSAYHRGVQRGRTAGDEAAGSVTGPSPNKETRA